MWGNLSGKYNLHSINQNYCSFERVNDGNFIGAKGKSIPFFLTYNNNFWKLTNQENLDTDDIQAFLKLETQGLKDS